MLDFGQRYLNISPLNMYNNDKKRDFQLIWTMYEHKEHTEPL